MNVKELVKIASAAFGPDWKVPLAKALKMSREMMWRYENEVTPISQDVGDRMRAICRKQISDRIAYLSKVLDKIAA